MERPVCAQSVDIGRWEEGAGEREAIRFTPRDVVLIEVKTGQRAVVQFTPIDDNHFRYRWRYRRSTGGAVQTGSGEVRERYKRRAKGSETEVQPLPGHNTMIQVGDIRTEWSTGGGGEGYLYYYAGRAEMRLLPSRDFEAEP
jgi:hypothetical protein